MKKTIYAILVLAMMAALSLFVFSSRKAHSLSSFDADSSGWIAVEVLKEGLSLRKIAQYDKIYFPRHRAFTDGEKIIFSVFGERGRIRFSYNATEEKISYVFFEPKAENPLQPFTHETNTLVNATSVYPFDRYTIEQHSQPGCIDTADTSLLIKEGDAEVMSIHYLGNIDMYKLDLDGDGLKELYLVNAYYCEGLFELYRIDRAKAPPE